MAVPRQNRGLRPRTTVYNNQQHGKRDNGMPPGDHTINAKIARVNLVRAQYKKGPLIFRPWPCLDPAEPTRLAPGRLNISARGQSDWIVRTSAAKYIGLNNPACERATFNLFTPWTDDTEKRNNPYRVLFFACKAAVKEGSFGPGRKWDSEWNKIMVGGTDRGAEMGGPSALWFCSGTVYANAEKNYVDHERMVPLGMHENDDLPVIQLPDSAGDQLINLLDAAKENYQSNGQEEEKPWLPFKFGDPTGIYNPNTDTVEGGLMVTIFNPKLCKVLMERKTNTAGQMTARKVVTIDGRSYGFGNTSWDGTIKEGGQGYEAAVTKTYQPDASTTFRGDHLTKQEVDRILALSQFFMPDPNAAEQDGLLYFPSYEEQCIWIAKAFKIVPRLLEYAWADHPEYLNDDVMGILNERRGEVMPGEEGEYSQEELDPTPQSRRPQLDPTQRSNRPPAAEDEFGDSPVVETTEELPEELPEEAIQGDDEFGEDAAAAPVATEAGNVDEFGEEGLTEELATEETAVEETEVATDDEFSGEAADAPAEEPGEAAGEATAEETQEGTTESVYEEDTTAPAPIATAAAKKEAEMRAAMAQSKARSAHRASVQTTAPAPAGKPAPTGKPAPAGAGKTAVAGRPVSTGKPAAAATGKPTAKPPVAGAATTARPAAAATGKPIAKPPVAATGKPAAAAGRLPAVAGRQPAAAASRRK